MQAEKTLMHPFQGAIGSLGYSATMAWTGMLGQPQARRARPLLDLGEVLHQATHRVLHATQSIGRNVDDPLLANDRVQPRVRESGDDCENRYRHDELQQRKAVAVSVVSRPWSVVESYLGFTIFV